MDLNLLQQAILKEVTKNPVILRKKIIKRRVVFLLGLMTQTENEVECDGIRSLIFEFSQVLI